MGVLWCGVGWGGEGRGLLVVKAHRRILQGREKKEKRKRGFSGRCQLVTQAVGVDLPFFHLMLKEKGKRKKERKRNTVVRVTTYRLLVGRLARRTNYTCNRSHRLFN